MVVYGVALLALCYLVGVLSGQLLGQLLGINANVGGVGIAMLLLLGMTGWLRGKDLLPLVTASGIGFWSAMYIPIVIAMAAKQNVLGALTGGWMAIIAGTAAVLASFALIPLLTKWSRSRGDAEAGQ